MYLCKNCKSIIMKDRSVCPMCHGTKNRIKTTNDATQSLFYAVWTALLTDYKEGNIKYSWLDKRILHGIPLLTNNKSEIKETYKLLFSILFTHSNEEIIKIANDFSGRCFDYIVSHTKIGELKKVIGDNGTEKIVWIESID